MSQALPPYPNLWGLGAWAHLHILYERYTQTHTCITAHYPCAPAAEVRARMGNRLILSINTNSPRGRSLNSSSLLPGVLRNGSKSSVLICTCDAPSPVRIAAWTAAPNATAWIMVCTLGIRGSHPQELPRARRACQYRCHACTFLQGP